MTFLRQLHFIKKIIQFTVLLSFTLVNTQELPPIEIFNSNDYIGGNQNWMITQASDKFIYVANNEGLLAYNGSNWKLYPSPNETIIRSVKVIDNNIYTGCFMEFGYWKKNKFGNLIYQSLLDKLRSKMIEDEQIWDIIGLENWVLFRSFDRIYIYNTDNQKFDIIEAKDQIQKIFKIKNTIYYLETNNDFYRIDGGKPSFFIDGSSFGSKTVVDVFSLQNRLLFLTKNNGFYFYENQKFTKWTIQADELLTKTSVYSSIKLRDNSFAVGTIANGIIYISDKGKIIYHINQINGLSNNTVLSQFIDADDNLWLGLDNGINIINLKSEITLYKDNKGFLGTIYCSKIFNGKLFLGTNQGLFYKKLNSLDNFKLFKNTKGQVWSLTIFDNTLFCGHHNGTYIILKEENIELIKTTIGGTWSIKRVPNNPDLLLQGTYDGFYVLEKENNKKWKVRNKIKGFDISSRFYEYISPNQLLINHEYKGIYTLSIDVDYKKVLESNLDTTFNNRKNSSIITYKNSIYYINKEGVFTYSNKKFIKDSRLSQLISDSNYISGKSVVDKSGDLWLFSKKNIYHITPSQLVNEPKVNTIPISSELRKGMIGFENLSQLSKNNYFIGVSNGYLLLDLAKLKQKEFPLKINNVFYKDKHEKQQFLPLKDNNILLENLDNHIYFSYGVPEYDKNLITEYQYKLEGFDSTWSDFSTSSKIDFKNLKYNTYNFKVRAKVGVINTAIVEYRFTIDKPWYLSNMFMLLYILLAILLTSIVHKTYKWYYKRQNNHNLIKSEKLIISIKNDQLNQDIESKSRELAISTMSLIKKNEALSKVKNELIAKNETGNASVIKLIDKNLNSEKDWEFFEQAFNNADKNFLSNIKKTYPNLTPNDLRFCAYLRLNITSKELAPLLNISYRSVEIKRYRLRKKMHLKSNQDLISHILDF